MDSNHCVTSNGLISSKQLSEDEAKSLNILLGRVFRSNASRIAEFQKVDSEMKVLSKIKNSFSNVI